MLGGFLRGGTAKAAGLAAATMAANLIAVVFTVIFTRLLGSDGYGSLAALLNLTLILLVPGSALQVAAAREGTLGRLGRGRELASTLVRWERHLLAGVLGLTVLAVLAREPLAALLNVQEEWAAAAIPGTAALWLLLSAQRGLLQAAQAYRPVGLSVVLEAFGRLAVGVLLVALGAGVTGAYLGTFGSMAITAAVLAVVLRRRLGAPAAHTPRHPLGALARDAAVPIAALTLVAVLQNVDVIMAKHVLAEDAAGVYAASTVAAKAVVWIAIGIGLWVLPEAVRRAAAGLDARSVLLRALGLVGAVALGALLVFGTVPEQLLRVAFGEEYEEGADVLLTLGGAYALLAATYLTVQFKLGLHRRAFIGVLAVVAVAEPLLLLGADDLEEFAAAVLAVQAAAAIVLLALALARRPTVTPTLPRAAP
jgi:O-antigen/teichoic acid export membrane protein